MLSLSIDPLRYVSKLPEFNGDYRDLQIFIDLVDKIQPTIAKYDAFSQSLICDNIKAKLSANVREIVEINDPVTDWLQIRKILISNFGVRGTIEELRDEMRSIKFKTNSAVLYNDVITALHKLNLKTKQTTDPTSASSSIESNKKAALTIFKNKLAEPMRSLLYCRNPSTLEEANNILHDCGYAYYCPANSHLYQGTFPFQHRPNVFQANKPTCGAFGTNAEAFSAARPTTSQTFGLFGGKPLNTATQSLFKQPEPKEFGMQSGMLQGQRKDPATQSTENVWETADKKFPFKNFTQNEQNDQNEPKVQQPSTNAETFSITSRTDRLPYIVVQGQMRPLKFIIDTGATHTILNPGLCAPDDIERLQTPITVKTLQNDVQITHKAVIPQFEELGDPQEKIECFIHPFHDRFDGLLGNNVLLPLKSQIDLENNTLIVGSKVIELHFKEEQAEDSDEGETDEKAASRDVERSLLRPGVLLELQEGAAQKDREQHEKPLVVNPGKQFI